MILRNILKIAGVLALSSLLILCGKKDEQKTGELVPKELTQDSSEVLTIKPKPINYDSMLTVVSQLVETLKNNPTDISLRQELVATSYDTTWETILAAGFGKPSQKAEIQSIARKFAEQAAVADAYRWAVYIKKWKIDPTIPDIGKFSTEIQAGKVVAKRELPDQNFVVLLEIHSSKIP
jgi:hypothetical protein